MGCPSGTAHTNAKVRPSTAVAMYSDEPCRPLAMRRLQRGPPGSAPLGSLYVGEPAALLCSPPHPHFPTAGVGGYAINIALSSRIPHGHARLQVAGGDICKILRSPPSTNVRMWSSHISNALRTSLVVGAAVVDSRRAGLVAALVIQNLLDDVRLHSQVGQAGGDVLRSHESSIRPRRNVRQARPSTDASA